MFSNTSVWCLHSSYMLSVLDVYDSSYNLLPDMGCMFFSIYLGLVISVKQWVMIVSGCINSRVSSSFLWKWQWVFRVEGNKDNFVIHHFSTGGWSYRKKGKETERREEIYIIQKLTCVTMTESICFFGYIFWIDPKNFFIYQTQMKIVF